MIYLIAGPPRSGKSVLAKRILNEHNIAYLSTDWIVHMLKDTNPDLGITDELHYKEKAELFYPYLNNLIKHINNADVDYLVEGDSFLPIHVVKLSKAYPIKSLFLISLNQSVETLKREIKGTWIESKSDKELAELAEWLKEMSLEYKEMCEEYDVNYLDTSSDFEAALKDAKDTFIE